ncbi:copper chaperone PCu(A)C [Pseudonocardia acidicola]|uniref:Copper chaperone PCu(A)C n=1 Tax=Pseudonocardia acidicola TaxID=2724939 RepID=A0ABX1SFQ4_9PSEU|nr:copper chaperone PCu(A)C [Pseudonocardia acidicola]NMH99211.1 copper chaperone PCu(A)C [Pseudonocardia acidicola]
MSRTSRFRPIRAAVLIGAMIGTVGLAGCGAGQISQTADQVPAVAGANVAVGHISVRNAQIEFPIGTAPSAAVYPRGGTAPVALTIVNESDQADRLIAATSSVGTVQVQGDTELPGQHLLVSGNQIKVPLPNSNQVQFTISGLRDDIRPGLTYPVTLTFQRAGDVTVDLPVGTEEEARRDQPAAESTGAGH